jgi:hypothetical protein
MYVILTSKPGKFRTELVEGLRPVAAFDYVFCGRKLAGFVIAELSGEVRLRVIDEAEPPLVNDVPSKFLQKFVTVEAAMAELRTLTAFGRMDARLCPR